MRVVLWDTRQFDVSKDFAGGYGIGQYQGLGGPRDWLIRRFYKRDWRPASLLQAYLAAGLGKLGHEIVYVEDRDPPDADLYIFSPSLITLPLERQTMARLFERKPGARVLVVGLVATMLPEVFSELPVTVVRGEAEQLYWRLDDVLAQPNATVQLGTIEDLDELPMPDWTPFRPRRFRIGYDFTRFPTALVQASRGCAMKCNYCPYIIPENSVRRRRPQAIVEEIGQGIERWGFRSFKFRDPLFGTDRQQVLELAERIRGLKRKIQFSIETRIELVPPEVLRLLHRAGLTSITVGIETPDEETMRRYRRAPVADDRQGVFIETCRSLGIRTVAGFILGFPQDTEASIRRVLGYAKEVNPTFANFNVLTPYPGTEFFEEVRSQIADFNFSRYNVYTPVMKYEHLTPEDITRLHAKCFRQFYFRWQWLRQNARVLWPWLRRVPGFGPGANTRALKQAAGAKRSSAVPAPLGGRDLLNRKGLRQDGPHRPRRTPMPGE
ncbi:MAG: B12-binding domain-containing radical SAM protein [Planctomycetota bacterium]